MALSAVIRLLSKNGKETERKFTLDLKTTLSHFNCGILLPGLIFGINKQVHNTVLRIQTPLFYLVLMLFR